MDTDYPTITATQYGRGKVIYFANQTDKLCFTNGHEDFHQLYYNALRLVLRETLLLETDMPSSVHVSLTRNQRGGYLLSLVNATGASARPFNQIAPLYGLSVTLFINGFKNARVLRGENISAYAEPERIRVEVPKLEEFAAVYIQTE
jgi:hypothetical protein